MLPTAPRHFLPSPALPGVGLPHDRAARMAARRAFVLLKDSFQHAVSDLGGSSGDWLRHQVRAAEEPTDLWLLRAPVYAALAGNGLEVRQRRAALRSGLQKLFPDSEPASSFIAF